MRLVILLTAVAVFSYTAARATNAPYSEKVSSDRKYYTKEQLVEDMDTLYSKINEIHPDMFARFPKSKFDRRFRRAKADLPDSLDAVAFYRIIAPLVSSLQDGHTGIYISRNDFKKSELYVFPDILYIKNGQLFIHRTNYTESRLNHRFAHHKIKSINGISAEKIMDMVLDMKTGIRHFRINQVNNDYLTFSVVLNAPEYAIEYHEGNTVKKSVTNGIEYNRYIRELAAMNARSQQKRTETKADKPEHERLPFEYTINEPLNTAVFTLKRFRTGNGALDGFLKEMFADIQNKGIGNLVIDIRDNGGGSSSVGDSILQYISPVNYSQFERMVVKISKPLKKSQPWFEEYPDGTIQTFDLTPDSLSADSLRFQGDIYLLTDNGTFSSGVSFASAFSHYEMGMTIGEKCGEPIADFGDVIIGYLPNTKLAFGCSCKMFLMAGATEEDMDTYVTPDIEVLSKDALKTAYDIIAKKQGINR